jgi:hypothetical protein
MADYLSVYKFVYKKAFNLYSYYCIISPVYQIFRVIA